MLEQFSGELLEAIFDTLPVDVTYVDENDTVRYYSKHDERVFRRTPAVIGLKVQNCHPKDSLDKVIQVVEELKSGKRKSAEFWICNNIFCIYVAPYPFQMFFWKRSSTLISI